MEISTGYLKSNDLPITDPTIPLIVGCCGTYRLTGSEHSVTRRPAGRSDYQLLYIAAGKAHFYFSGEDRIVPAGHMVLFQPGQPQHYEYFAEDTPQVSWIHFSGYEVEHILQEYALLMDDPVFYVGTSSSFENLFKSIIAELQSRKPGFEKLTATYLQQVFLFAYRARSQQHETFSSFLQEETYLARDYFSTHYSEPICIELYAQSRGISVSWLQRGFRKLLNQSPAHFLLMTRLNNAAILLETTDHAIGSIAAMVGYEDPLYFSRLFRKYKGLSPSEYRRAVCPKSNLP